MIAFFNTALGQEGTGLRLELLNLWYILTCIANYIIYSCYFTHKKIPICYLFFLLELAEQIADKKVDEKGTCFKFYTYLSICETDQVAGNVREYDIESYVVTYPVNRMGRVLCFIVLR